MPSVTGRGSFFLRPLFDAVVHPFATFHLGAFLGVTLPAALFSSHQIAKAADSTGVTGRCPVSVLHTLLDLPPLPLEEPFL